MENEKGPIEALKKIINYNSLEAIVSEDQKFFVTTYGNELVLEERKENQKGEWLLMRRLSLRLN